VLRSPSKISDPDPIFQVNPDPIGIQGFDDQKFKKKIQLKICLNLFFFQNCHLLFSRHPALEREHPALQNLDPDPQHCG
jgi:hypothetical protein